MISWTLCQVTHPLYRYLDPQVGNHPSYIYIRTSSYWYPQCVSQRLEATSDQPDVIIDHIIDNNRSITEGTVTIAPHKRKVPLTPVGDSATRPTVRHRSTRSTSSVPDALLWPASLSALRQQRLIDDQTGVYQTSESSTSVVTPATSPSPTVMNVVARTM